MSRDITAEEFGNLFKTFEHTLFRLETRDTYHVATETQEFQDWLAGKPTAADRGMNDWRRTIKAARAAGKQWGRVRVVTEPHTDYTRWLLDVTRSNIEAGEDIRYLPRARADELGLPYEDWWLFDSHYALKFHFDDQGVICRYELDDDIEATVRRNKLRDIAMHYAIPWRDYAASHGVNTN